MKLSLADSEKSCSPVSFGQLTDLKVTTLQRNARVYSHQKPLEPLANTASQSLNNCYTKGRGERERRLSRETGRQAPRKAQPSSIGIEKALAEAAALQLLVRSKKEASHPGLSPLEQAREKECC